MTIEELNATLARGEGTRTEYKQARTRVPSDLYDTVCSFLNKEGGIIILGADNDGNVTGIDPTCIEQMKKDIITALNNRDVINPPVNYPIYELEKDNEKVFCLKIPVSSQVHTHAGIIYDRENDSDFKIIDETRISEIYFRKRQNFTENIIYRHLTMDDLDATLFDKAKAWLYSANPLHPWLDMDNIAILRSSLLYRKDVSTGEEGLTLAAALIFGKDTTISSILPAYKIEALVRRENLDRWDDRLTLRTNLIDSYLQLMDFVRKHLNDKFYLDGDVRKDLRTLIFREIVGNIIVHREYTNNYSTEFVIYKDRVETTNPNKVLFRGPLSLDTFSPYAKNPNIRRFFNEFKWTDEIGSGVRNVNKYLKIYANGAKPVFIEDDSFKAIIPLMQETMGNRAELIIEFLGLVKAKLGKDRLDKLKEIPLSPDFAKMDDSNEFLFKKGGSWAEKGGKLQNSRIQNISSLSFNDFQKGGSWAEKGGKLLPKRTAVILRIILGCILPVSNEELLHIIFYTNREKLRDLYIAPLRKDGILDYTIKDKPRDPGQKYVLTEKGRAFLGGFDV